MQVSIRKLLGCLCGVWLAWLIVAAASVGTASLSTSVASAAFKARALRALTAGLAHALAPGMRDRSYPKKLINGTTQVRYYNWSGYANSSSTTGEFTAISGSWTVPAVTCTPEHQTLTAWVGLDGLTNGRVEQDGTLSQCYEGKIEYYSWYEMYPTNPSVVIVGQTVKPGDKILGSVRRTGTSYKLTLTDSTTSGNNISVTETCPATTCVDTSAEWIGERDYFGSNGYSPLAQFKTPISFTSASETSAGKTGTISTGPSPEQIFMIDATGAYNLATPSSLNGTGNAFTDKWDDSW